MLMDNIDIFYPKGNVPVILPFNDQEELRKRLFNRNLKRLLTYKTPVFITGPKGAGKEYWARYIHSHGTMKNGPFVVVETESVPASFLDFYLFGATKIEPKKKGMHVLPQASKIRQAFGGTLYLTEAAVLPYVVQKKLYELVQRRPGEDVHKESQPFRLILGSRHDLNFIAERKLLLREFFYRVSIYSLRLTPLKNRLDTIPSLVSVFTKLYSHVLKKSLIIASADVLQILREYSWPGNIDELREVIFESVKRAEKGEKILLRKHLPQKFWYRIKGPIS
jgi:DNA-binding NtrC family response regulator